MIAVSSQQECNRKQSTTQAGWKLHISIIRALLTAEKICSMEVICRNMMKRMKNKLVIMKVHTMMITESHYLNTQETMIV